MYSEHPYQMIEVITLKFETRNDHYQREECICVSVIKGLM